MINPYEPNLDRIDDEEQMRRQREDQLRQEQERLRRQEEDRLRRLAEQPHGHSYRP